MVGLSILFVRSGLQEVMRKYALYSRSETCAPVANQDVLSLSGSRSRSAPNLISLNMIS